MFMDSRLRGNDEREGRTRRRRGLDDETVADADIHRFRRGQHLDEPSVRTTQFRPGRASAPPLDVLSAVRGGDWRECWRASAQGT